MKKNILVTGGAGFIGSFLVDELVKQHNVRILDNLEPQVHQGKMPDYLNKKAEFIKGDIRNEDDLKKAIKDIDVIFHYAAMVGVGQSMYQIIRYTDVNTLGTAKLLDLLVNTEHKVKKLIVASSMSTYGEGSYECNSCGKIEPDLRPEKQMSEGKWGVSCPLCKKEAKPLATKETKTQRINSIYALTKKDQEDMVINIAKSYGIPSVALRFFNVYGPRQSLSNPYTGVVAIFLSRLKNNNPPVVYEDGNQSRDFVSVHDIVQASVLAMENKAADYKIFNVGAGNQITIKEIAEKLAKLTGKSIQPKISGQFRKGDVRHCYSDINKISETLGFKPRVDIDEGLKELIQWSSDQEAEDMYNKAEQELKEKNLI